jgi:hypothetical protein
MVCELIYDVFSVLFVLLVCIKYRDRLWQIPQPILVSARTTVPLLVLRGLDTLACPGLASKPRIPDTREDPSRANDANVRISEWSGRSMEGPGNRERP